MLYYDHSLIKNKVDANKLCFWKVSTKCLKKAAFFSKSYSSLLCAFLFLESLSEIIWLNNSSLENEKKRFLVKQNWMIIFLLPYTTD